MLSFAMDCWFAGMALCLWHIARNSLHLLSRNGHFDFLWLSLIFGLCLFLFAKFAFSLIILWSMWE